MSVKSKTLGILRKKLFVDTFLEQPLRIFVKGAPSTGLRSKFLPNHDLFPPNSPRTLEDNGRKITFNVGEWMEWAAYFGLLNTTAEHILPRLKSGDYVVDIGTNIGSVIIPMAKKIGPTGKAYGFEPSPGRFKKCQEHLIFEQITNAELIPKALGSSEGEVILESPDERNEGRTKINLSATEGERVKNTTLDRWVAEEKLKQINFVKIDVEGFEFEVLKGMKQVIHRFHPLILVEIDRSNLSQAKSSPEEVMDYLKEAGYVLKMSDGGPIILPLLEHFDLLALPT